MVIEVPFVESSVGRALPFIADRLHSVGGRKVPQRMLFPSGPMLAAGIAKIPAGHNGSQIALRVALAAEHGAETTCPVTTARLLRDLAAETVAAWETGRRDVVPFWRVVDPDRPTARILAGGADFIRARRAEETA